MQIGAASLLCSNGTDNLSSVPSEAPSLADLPVLVAGTLVFFLILPVVLFEFRIFPIGTTSAAMLGASLMVICQVVPQEDVYSVLGERGHLSTVFLLLGMMLLAQYTEREQMLTKLLRRVLRPSLMFPNYIWRVSLISFLFSALFTNDASCAILTPLLLKFWEVQERSHSEVEVIVLAISTSANIGSVMTIFGNPQMAIIAAQTSSHPFKKSMLDLRGSLLYLGPPAILAYFMNLGFLLLLYQLKMRQVELSKLLSEASSSAQEMAGLTNGLYKDRNGVSHMNGGIGTREDILYDGILQSDSRNNLPCNLETIPEDEVLEITSTSTRSVSMMDSQSLHSRDVEHLERDVEAGVHNDSSSDDSDEDTPSNTSDRLNSLDIDYKPSALTAQSQNLIEAAAAATHSPDKSPEHGLRLSQSAGIYRSLSAVTPAEFLHEADCDSSREELFSSSDSVTFQLVLSLIIVGVVGMFLASSPTVYFDLGLVPVCAAVLVITADAVINGRSAVRVMKRVDWSILIMFFAIFVWIHGFTRTRLPRWLWYHSGMSRLSERLNPLDISIFVAFVAVGSNVFSNVPLTLIILEQLLPCQEQFGLIVMLAWVVTISGNLTLFGSVANLIVAQKARETVSYRLTFFTFLRYGVVTTVPILVMGVLLLYGLLQI